MSVFNLSATVERRPLGLLGVSWDYYYGEYSSSMVTVRHNITHQKWIVLIPDKRKSISIQLPEPTSEDVEVTVALVKEQLVNDVEALAVLRQGICSTGNPLDLLSTLRDLTVADTSSTCTVHLTEHATGKSDQRSITNGITNQRITVTIETTNITAATVRWSTDLEDLPDSWHVSLSKDVRRYGDPTSWIFLVEGSRRELVLPLKLSPNKKYVVLVTAMYACGSVESDTANDIKSFVSKCEGSTDFYSDHLTLSDIRELHSRAIKEANEGTPSQCHWLYRNKSPEYFSEILSSHGGLMEVYIKDNSGDPASPINGRINGLFFLANVQPGTDLPLTCSPFGKCRLLIPSEVLFRLAPNLYFADYYCMRGYRHYVTLVMTKSGSEADLFCRDRLLRLDLDENSDNPFIFRRFYQWYVADTSYLMIELLYTEDIDINDVKRNFGAKFDEDVQIVGSGRSTPGGLRKNATCAKCNLDPPQLPLSFLLTHLKCRQDTVVEY